MKKSSLRLYHYILLVSFLSFVLAIAATTWSSYKINTRNLKEETLETNRVYAEKLAQTTGTYLTTTIQTMAYSAKELAGFMDDEEEIQLETYRLMNQMNTFNSIVVTNAAGKILSASPEKLNLENQILNTEGGQQALSEKKVIISDPYLSLTGRHVIFISIPIFDDNQTYLGLVGGSIYLKEANVLYELLGEHFYEDSSYVFVVDRKGEIIYHQDEKRILDDVNKNDVVRKVLNGENGASEVTNTQGVDMLAGYASIPLSNWGIISQRETDVSLRPAKKMLLIMLLAMLPLVLISLIVLYFISKKIARPLNQLAYYAEISTDRNQEVDLLQIDTYYYEAFQLKKALLFSFAFLHNQMNHYIEKSTTDSLTKLHNRRAFEEVASKLLKSQVPFSIVLLDIDNFKKINDTYGHNVGDETLLFLANQMKDGTRLQDECCRYGGEEFIMLLPETGVQEAWIIADRLRKNLSEQVGPTGGIITISAGISTFPQDAANLVDLILEADKRLYKAKSEGKNRVIVEA